MTDAMLYEALCRFITPERRARIEQVAPLRTRHLTVVLQDIYQSHNASAVVRTCDLLGVQDLHVIEERNAYSLSEEVTLGSSKWVDIHRHRGAADNTAACLAQLRRSGHRIVVTSPHARGRTPNEIAMDRPMAICFGTELTGASAALIEAADEHLRIPMYGFTESYNISVSAAIVLFTLAERLRASRIPWKLPREEIFALQLRWVRGCVRDAAQVEERIRREHDRA